MPPKLMLLAGFGLIGWLVKVDRDLRRLPSSADWIPIIWLAILGSRSVSLWLSILGLASAQHDSIEGSPVDSIVFLLLIAGAVIILIQRRFQWGVFVSNNKLLILIYVYLAVSAIWADNSLPTLKRSFKDFGNVLIALVILTEASPIDVLRTVFVRLAYFVFPLSIVLIKWFPEIGRVANRSGDSLFCGVTTHKNTLGVVVFVFCLFIIIDILALRADDGASRNRKHLWIRYLLFAMGIYLLQTADSMTARICLVLGVLVFWFTKFALRLGNPKKVILITAAILAGYLAADDLFQVSANLMIELGRDPTMTGRTQIWDWVKVTQVHPVLGYGYYSYWESPAAQPISARFDGTLKTMHHGYHEMYMDGGVVGLTLLLLLLAGWGYRSVDRSLEGSLFGRLSLVFWTVSIIYNLSETDFFRLEPLWFTLLLMMVRYPFAQSAPAGDPRVIPTAAAESDPAGLRFGAVMRPRHGRPRQPI
jgi:exopolysaccharide production protein ExoQ